MKPVLMIHEVSDQIFNLPLQDYILTFDDGLYSQYKIHDRLLSINTTKIFFISTNIVAEEHTKQNDAIVDCATCHERFFNSGDFSNYMNWEQILELSRLDQFYIGGHSHNHHRPEFGSIISDTRAMMNTFKSYDLSPVDFCFPYNHYCEVYKKVLTNYVYVNFYGKDRIPIEDLYEHS